MRTFLTFVLSAFLFAFGPAAEAKKKPQQQTAADGGPSGLIKTWSGTACGGDISFTLEIKGVDGGYLVGYLRLKAAYFAAEGRVGHPKKDETATYNGKVSGSTVILVKNTARIAEFTYGGGLSGHLYWTSQPPRGCAQPSPISMS